MAEALIRVRSGDTSNEPGDTFKDGDTVFIGEDGRRWSDIELDKSKFVRVCFTYLDEGGKIQSVPAEDVRYLLEEDAIGDTLLNVRLHKTLYEPFERRSASAVPRRDTLRTEGYIRRQHDEVRDNIINRRLVGKTP